MDMNGSRKMGKETDYLENKLPARLLSVGEVARFLGVHTSTVRRWEKKGLLKSYTIGLRNNLRFKQEDVLNLLNECQPEGMAGIKLSDVIDEAEFSARVSRR